MISLFGKVSLRQPESQLYDLHDQAYTLEFALDTLALYVKKKYSYMWFHIDYHKLIIVIIVRCEEQVTF